MARLDNANGGHASDVFDLAKCATFENASNDEGVIWCAHNPSCTGCSSTTTAPTKAPTKKPTPDQAAVPPPDSQYALLEQNTICRSSAELLTSSDECFAAIETFQLPVSKKRVVEKSWLPTGCSMRQRDEGKYVAFFNTATGEASNGAQPVCLDLSTHSPTPEPTVSPTPEPTVTNSQSRLAVCAACSKRREHMPQQCRAADLQ